MQFLLIYKQKQCEWADDCYRTAVSVMFTHMSTKQGIKKFKEQDVASITNQYKQPHNVNIFGRVCPEDQTTKKKRDALRATTLVEEKRSGNIKGRSCTYGRAQREYITKEEVFAPTVSTEALLAQLMIDAFQERAMEIFDIPGAYLNAEIPEDKFVLLKLEDQFVDVTCEVTAQNS